VAETAQFAVHAADAPSYSTCAAGTVSSAQISAPRSSCRTCLGGLFDARWDMVTRDRTA
jgi:hypothetical protein